MREQIALVLVMCCGLVIAAAAFGQDQPSVPTLTPPTLAPYSASPLHSDSLASTSAAADIAEHGFLRAGVLFNDPPYSSMDRHGELRGYDIGLLRLIAETWGVELELVQATRQNALQQLNSASVHVVASAFVHYRHLDGQLEFSQAYLTGRQALMVREESAFESPLSLVSSRVGYVLGTRAEIALRLWEAALGMTLDAHAYLTLDRAIAALGRGDIEAALAEEQDLLQVAAGFVEEMRILDEAVLIEPRALAVRRQDLSMRHLLNRTIQYLTKAGKLEVLFREYFPGEVFPVESIVLWENVGEAPKPEHFAGDLVYPGQYSQSRVFGSGRLRVGGLSEAAEGDSTGEGRLAMLNRALVEEIGRRWEASVVAVSSGGRSALELLQEGEVDLVVGVEPDWGRADIADYAGYYLLHGDRLMIPSNARIAGFNDLRGRWIGVMIGDEGARERAQSWADSIKASVRFYQSRSEDAALNLLEYKNANAIYANSLSLIPHLEAYPRALKLTDRWYSRSYYAFAVQKNDIDFRLLVDYTMQEMMRDGALERLAAPLNLSDRPLSLIIVPGAPSHAGRDA